MNAIWRRPAASRVARRRSGVLSGDARWHAKAAIEGLEHHPLAHGHLAQLGELAGEQRPRVGVREQARLGSDEAAALCEVVDGRGEAVVREPCGCDRVTELGALPEGEQGLVAACLGTGSGDGEDLLGAQVGGGETSRRLGEGAVAAAVLAQHREWDEHLRERR